MTKQVLLSGRASPARRWRRVGRMEESRTNQVQGPAIHMQGLERSNNTPNANRWNT
jgi:hypothetical protein